jgi:hypothetical protein
MWFEQKINFIPVAAKKQLAFLAIKLKITQEALLLEAVNDLFNKWQLETTTRPFSKEEM